MKIIIKMPTGKFIEDSSGNQQLDGESKPIPVLEDKEFLSPFISGRKLQETVIMGDKIQTGSNADTIGSMAGYISNIFGYQFTKDQALDGLSSIDLISEFTRCIQEVTGGLNEKVDELAETSPNA